MVTSHTGPGITNPDAIAADPDGALWFTNGGNDTVGRITTSGTVSSYPGPGISDLGAIAVGPDGTLWFTNENTTTIGRIAATGRVTFYSARGMGGADAIIAGPDGALWFTSGYLNSIERTTTAVTPKITSSTPRSGTAGTTVTITGHNLPVPQRGFRPDSRRHHDRHLHEDRHQGLCHRHHRPHLRHRRCRDSHQPRGVHRDLRGCLKGPHPHHLRREGIAGAVGWLAFRLVAPAAFW